MAEKWKLKQRFIANTTNKDIKIIKREVNKKRVYSEYTLWWRI